MRSLILVLGAGLLAGSLAPAQAQGPVPDAARSGAPPGFVPGKDQPTESSVSDAERRDAPARDVPNGQVAPPAAINSGVQVIAPEKK